jgi:hypothetical protein
MPVDRSTLAVYSPLETSYDRYCNIFSDESTSEHRRQEPVAVEPEISLEQRNQLPSGRVLDTI